jgi:hypothetical protein
MIVHPRPVSNPAHTTISIRKALKTRTRRYVRKKRAPYSGALRSSWWVPRVISSSTVTTRGRGFAVSGPDSIPHSNLMRQADYALHDDPHKHRSPSAAIAAPKSH